MKKFITIMALTLVIALSFTACGNKNEKPIEENNSSETQNPTDTEHSKPTENTTVDTDASVTNPFEGIAIEDLNVDGFDLTNDKIKKAFVEKYGEMTLKYATQYKYNAMTSVENVTSDLKNFIIHYNWNIEFKTEFSEDEEKLIENFSNLMLANISQVTNGEKANDTLYVVQYSLVHTSVTKLHNVIKIVSENQKATAKYPEITELLNDKIIICHYSKILNLIIWQTL